MVGVKGCEAAHKWPVVGSGWRQKGSVAPGLTGQEVAVEVAVAPNALTLARKRYGTEMWILSELSPLSPLVFHSQLCVVDG